MKLPSDWPSDLKAFAMEQIAADKYPEDYHIFKIFKCDTCGTAPFELTVEEHTGSKKGDFKGVITGKCRECSEETKLFSFTGEHRKPEHTDNPKCECRKTFFFVGECERMEGDEGIMGFFDEGVVVGKCASCGQNKAIVFTD